MADTSYLTTAQLHAKAHEMLRAADAVLSGDTDIPARRRTRAAALLARTALELAIDARLAAAGAGIEKAGTRVKLICLRAMSPGIADDAAVAWTGLSRACHQHAYELAPIHSETRHLAELTRRVLGDEP